MKEAEQWSRHYDSTQWTAIYVFTATISALLGFTASNAYSWTHWYIVLMGLWFTNLTIYYAASFRQLRSEILLEIDDEATARFLTRKKAKTWTPFVLTYALLDACWIGLAIGYLRQTIFHVPFCVSIPVSTPVMTGLGLFLKAKYEQGAGYTFDQWKAIRAERSCSTGVDCY